MGAPGEPSLLGFVLACLLWLLLGVVPGLLVATWLVPERSRLDRLAVAPLLSIALGFAPAAWLSTLGLPQAWHAAWVVPLALSSALIVGLVRRGALGELVAWSPTVRRVGLAVLASTASWCVALTTSMPGWSAVVPDQDGGSHGVFVTRILLSGLVRPDRVAVFDLADPGAQSVFYPLGVHALAAPVAALTTVSSALMASMTVLASAVLVVGTAALARRVGGSALVLPASLVAAVLLPWFPFAQAPGGPVPLVLGVAAVPSLVLALLDLADRRALLVGALALGGMLALHTTEAMVAVVVVAVAVALGAVAGRRSALVRLLVVGALAGVVVAPVVLGLLSGGAARPQEPAHGSSALGLVLWAVLRPATALDTSTEPALWYVASAVLAAAAVTALAVTGAIWLRRSPLAKAVAVAVAGCVVLGALARVGIARPLVIPWYGNADRLAAQAAGLMPALVGAGWLALGARAADRGARILLGCLAVGAASVLAVQGVATARDGLSRLSVVTADDRAAFAWLAAHVRPGERVLNDHRDGSLWAYDASHGAVAPVFGPKPSGGYEADPLFDSRLRLRDEVGRLATDPWVRDEARALSVRYVLIGSDTMGDTPRLLDVDAIAASPAFREVFRAGGARVFEIVDG